MSTRTRPAEFRTNHEWAMSIARQDIERMKARVGQPDDHETFEDAVAGMLAAHLVIGWAQSDRLDELRAGS